MAAQNNEQMWRMLIIDFDPDDFNNEKKLCERLLRHRATEALQTQALLSALRKIQPLVFNRAIISALRDSHILLVKAEAERLRDRMRVHAPHGETADDMLRRRKECEAWFGGIFVWPRDDGQSAFAFLDEWKPLTPAHGDDLLPGIRIECAPDVEPKAL